jgi:hypothetical protein
MDPKNFQMISTMISECLKVTQLNSANFAVALETESGETIWFASGGKLIQKLMKGDFMIRLTLNGL